MSQITIPGLPNNPAPPSTVLFEISNAGVSENVTLAAIIVGLQNVSEKNQPNGYPGLDAGSLIASGQIPNLPQSRIIDLVSDLALKEDLANKGAVSGYAGLDASQQLLLGNFPPGNALEFLRRNAANTALEFAVITPVPQTPWQQDIDAATFNLLNSGFLEQNEITEPATPGAGLVRLWSENDSGFSVLRFKGNNGIVNNISEDIFIEVRNVSGLTINKGKVVYVTGAQGQRITVDLAKADSNNTMRATGFMLEDLPNNSNGLVVVAGGEKNINTSAFSAGDSLYVSATTAGEVTNISPLHPNISQVIAIVLVSNPTTGEISVVPGDTNGQELGTNSNQFLIGDGLAGLKEIQMTNDFVMSLQFNPTANRTLTFPDVTDTMVGKATTDIFTNKSIDALTNTITNIGSPEVIPDIISGQTLKAVPVFADEILITDSAAAGVLKRTTLTALITTGQTPILQNVDYASFNIVNLGLLNTHTIPGGTDTFAMIATAQILTNKIIDFASNTLTTTLAELQTAVSDATLVDLDDAQILTNKTIDAGFNTISGVSAITGLGTQVQALNMDDFDIVFGATTGGKIGTVSSQKIAFYGNTPIIQPVDGDTLTNNVTVGGTTNQIDDFTDLSTYATDAATIRNDIYQLARKVKIITDNLRTLGLES